MNYETHHPFCNFWNGPIGGPGCICVITYKQRMNELETAETKINTLTETMNELIAAVAEHLDDGNHYGPRSRRLWNALANAREKKKGHSAKGGEIH